MTEQFPDPLSGSPPPASGALPKDAYTPWLTRVGAWIIDAIPPAIIAGIGVLCLFLSPFQTEECVYIEAVGERLCEVQISAVGWTLFTVFIVASVVFGFWNQGYRQGTTGSSIGKSMMKFKVISENTGQPIGFVMSIVRQIAHFVDGIICYIGYLFPLWDAKRQTLADKIMKTVCVPI